MKPLSNKRQGLELAAHFCESAESGCGGCNRSIKPGVTYALHWLPVLMSWWARTYVQRIFCFSEIRDLRFERRKTRCW